MDFFANSDLLLLISAIAFFILGVIWSKYGWVNVFIKIALFALAGMDGFATLYQLGWLIQIAR
ncbi:MAG: hypothetical protein HY455_03195 [Parcubacteria group bacterium]|nr:hypothetical protein [Parcubacteria group bacterium]